MKTSDPGNGCGRSAGDGREQRLDDDYTEFERQSGFAGERAYPTGWRPTEDRGMQESQETWRPAGPGLAPGRGVHRGKGPKSYRRSDARILEELCDRLTDDGDVDATDVECSVQDGEVTLNGSVATRPEQRRAGQLSGSVRGVVAVHDRIHVRHEANP
jgi:hypothetical protein